MLVFPTPDAPTRTTLTVGILTGQIRVNNHVAATRHADADHSESPLKGFLKDAVLF
jgi:hypothetical protein